MKNQNQTSLAKRIIKYSLATFFILIALIAAIIGIALNTVLSPDKLTPIVLNQAPTYIKPLLATESVDITFFSSFPDFRLNIKQGSLSEKNDTLIRFKEIGIGIRPLKYLTKKEVHISNISIKDAQIFAIVDSAGNPNWDIMIAADTTTQTQDTLTANQSALSSLRIDRISFEDVNLTFKDIPNHLYFNLEGLTSSLSGSFGKRNSELSVDLTTRNLFFEQDGKTLVSHLSLGLTSQLLVDTETMTYTTEKTVIDINGIKAGCKGSIQKDTLSESYLIDMHAGMNIPSLNDVLKLIPTSIVREAADVSTRGDVSLTASLKGVYGKGSFPIVDMKAAINNGSFHYNGMPHGVDNLDLDMNGHFNLNEKSHSYLTINNFLFKGASSEINIAGNISQALSDPRIAANIQAKIDFTTLAKSFPLEKDVVMEGMIDSRLKGEFNLSSIKNKDLGKLDLQGFLKMTDIKLESPSDSFLVNVKSAGFAFGANQKDESILQGKNLLNAVIGFDDVRMDAKFGQAQMDSVRINVKSSPLKDTTAIVSLQANIAYKHLNARLKDTINAISGPAKLSLRINPSASDKKTPQINSILKFDSLSLSNGEDRMHMKRAGFELESIKGKEYKKQWISNGRIGFTSLSLWLKDFPLPIDMPASVVILNNDELVLKNASVKMGNSDIALNGKFTNLKKTFFEQGTLKGEYELNSSFIDCNEIIKALQPSDIKSQSSEEKTTLAKQEEPVSKDSMSVFIVPDKINFVLHSKIDQVHLGHMKIERIQGDIIIKNQTIELAGLNMHTFAADMQSTLVYKAKDGNSAYTGFDVKMQDIQVGKLVELMPALDTLVPMLRSIDGIVNFRIAAETNLKQDMSPVVPSIQAAVNLRGDSLVLMDGQTFTEISKMLRFKNKERNIIDSISVDMIVRNGQIEIYPFKITMDRYVAAVGGKHNLDMTYNYHVSLLESPIPFKVGVDIKGNMDDFKFRITKPKYKDMHKAVRKSAVDSTSITLRQRIRNIVERKDN